MTTVPDPKVFTLDLGGIVGWALGRMSANAPTWGKWKLPDIGGAGARYAAFEDELEAALTKHQPDLVVAEAPMHIAAMNGEAAARQQLGLTAYTQGSCARLKIEYQEIGRDDVLVEILGQCRFGEKGEGKQRLRAWVRRQGWDVTDMNVSDAIGVWEHRRRLHRRMWAR